MKGINITIAQISVKKGQKKKNINAVARLLENAEFIGDIVLLPEAFNTGYIFDDASEVHQMCENYSHSETVEALQVIASRYQTTIVAGIPEEHDGEFYNSVAVIDGEGLQGTYRKISQNKIDKRYYSRGNKLLAFEVGGVKCGVVVCFDVWFPEITRAYEGVDVLLHPANFGGQQSFSICQARALEQGLAVVTANRVGVDSTEEFDAEYCGQSRIYNAQGVELANLGKAETVATISLTDFSIAPQFNGIDFLSEVEAIRASV
ncbi:carbon-nitrogen hydrolase family protein [Vibrio diabolicus]|uniref:carbon-nitrogen hydrolase family protein n=1 Tax=Vibrio diabolicus TaxID=50719 RepID=UPI00062E577F|nr:carbon-nitrogen hydrolase family protein [Vibrio diabolicus]KLE25316.1 carbon-nitrogen hydrolase [Vibrio diabolicus]